MGRRELVVREENCTGCRICEMICAWNFLKEFSPTRAYLTVEVDEKTASFQIKVTEDCKNCGLCAKYCAAGALETREAV